MTMIVKSESFSEGEMIGSQHVLSEDYGFGCSGDNLSPQLSWSGAPVNTKSYAVTCFDPDAPTGSGFWHWVVVNIPANVMSLPLGAGDPASRKIPTPALQVRTDFGKPGYGGPCSPEGSNIHRYIFTVYSVDLESLPVTVDTSAALVGFYLNIHTIEKASLIGVFRR